MKWYKNILFKNNLINHQREYKISPRIRKRYKIQENSGQHKNLKLDGPPWGFYDKTNKKKIEAA